MSDEFSLVPETTVALAATVATARVLVPGGTKHRRTIRIVNSGPNTAFVKFGDVTVTAAVTDHPVLINSWQDFTLLEGQTHVAAICGTGTAALAITVGGKG